MLQFEFCYKRIQGDIPVSSSDSDGLHGLLSGLPDQDSQMGEWIWHFEGTSNRQRVTSAHSMIRSLRDA